MKTILRIIVILLVATVVAEGFSLAVNNTSITSGSAMEGGQPPAMTSADGQTIQPMERSEGGDHNSISLARSLSGVCVTLAKLTVIAIIVLLAEKTFSLFPRRKASLVP